MCGCEMADLPSRSVGITSMCTTKLEGIHEIKTCGESNLKTKL